MKNNKTKILNIVGLIINLGIIACFIVGFFIEFLQPAFEDARKYADIGKNILEYLKYYNFLTAIMCFVASIAMLVANIKSIKGHKDRTPRLTFTLRFIAMGMSALALFSIAAVFTIFEPAETKWDLLIKGSNLFFNLIIPLASILLFMFFELEPKCRFKKNFGPFIIGLVYTGVIITLMQIITVNKGVKEAAEFAPYTFYLYTQELIDASGIKNIRVSATISCLIISVVLSFVLPVLIYLVNRVLSSKIIGYEYTNKKKDLFDDDRLTKKEKIRKYVKSKTTHEVSVDHDNIYHVVINNRKAKTYRVIEPNTTSGKVFANIEAATDYACKLAEQHHGGVRIHNAMSRVKNND